MKNTGETIKKIRNSRLIRQSDIANNGISRSAISKIENSKQKLAYEDAILFCNSFGMSLSEFEYIANNYSLSLKSSIIYNFLNISSNFQKDKINILIKQCEPIKNEPDIKLIYNILLAFRVLNTPNGLEKAKKIILPIWNNYLSKIETWSILDLYVLDTIFFVFNDEMMNYITKIAIQEIKEKYPFLKRLESSFLINKSYLQMRKRKFIAAKESLNNVIKLCKETSQHDKLLFAKGRYAICVGDKISALHYKHLLKEIGEDELSYSLNCEIENFKANF
ncbi:helix-turn-helix transcriptional regulator [Lactobacillus sp. ESL0679]|uniref:helix-turn-helix domain-containing protein n=1 Tax=Lactobacillus sp. ESL0679 TaxID=2983209 RepID=UPI0023F65443|nr:helix-turn-helix transcriptional regulator [Lactobacillus sp. ESL0679]MDF7681956.1 helix-turn-helix transcriptional regulator [Lactobacillus sp. ESL0679]